MNKEEKWEVAAPFPYPTFSNFYYIQTLGGVLLLFFRVEARGRGFENDEECLSSPFYIFIWSTNVSITY